MGQKDYLAMYAIGWIPDLALSWAFMKLSDNAWSSFWWCLLGLTIAQLFFSFKKFVAGSLIFHFYSRNKWANAIMEELQRLEMPKPAGDRDYFQYRGRIETDDEFPPEMRQKALNLQAQYGAVEQQGPVQSLRLSSASNLALNRYAGLP